MSGWRPTMKRWAGGKAYQGRRGYMSYILDVRGRKWTQSRRSSSPSTIDNRGPGRCMMAFSFSLRLSFNLRFASSSTDGRPHSFLSTAVGIHTSVDPLRWTSIDSARGRENETRTPSSEPLSWMLPSSSVSATRPWQNGCLVHWRKAMRKKSLNRSVLSFFLFPSSPTRSRPLAAAEASNPPTPIHCYNSFGRALSGPSNPIAPPPSVVP